VSKNTIRESNQGCIVLAGTSDVLIQENIAYDTIGHCFVLQDGMETGNTLRRNLGARTRQAEVFDQSYTNSEEGLDTTPSTFLISNPSNVVEENVGAGSQGEAFAIILRSKVIGLHSEDFPSIDPASLLLTQFRGNVAHSNNVVSYIFRVGFCQLPYLLLTRI
jgi:hypothetical protein